jgi:hypothetical protein
MVRCCKPLLASVETTAVHHLTRVLIAVLAVTLAPRLDCAAQPPGVPVEPVQQPAPAPLPAAAQPPAPVPQPPAPVPQPAPQPARTAPQPLPRGNNLASVFGDTQSPFIRRRLTRVPDMFGDSPGLAGTLTVAQFTPFLLDASADVPLAAGTTHLLVGENNKALPVDRVYFNYNHFQNALRQSAVQTTAAIFATEKDLDLNLYTLGLEQTFFDGVWSVEVRVPLAGNSDLRFAPDPLEPIGVTAVRGGEFGNVSVILKTLLWADDTAAFAAGLGVETPTGDDGEVRVGTFRHTLENESFHLHPYLALLLRPDEDVFFNAFLQFDFAANGNPLRATSIAGVSAGELGEYNDQSLVRLNLSTGYWLYRTLSDEGLTGVAGIVELHYTSALQDTDTVAASLVDQDVLLAERRNRFDFLNLTIGLHAELYEDTLVRLAVGLPLRSGDNRSFDAELLLQITQRF